jgi:O-acetyl-ADP-ribose deacetylase (regulator of RNase III)
MAIKYIKGNIFNSKTQTIVNTVNCVGVMGKGIALVFKLRYPKMYDLYKQHCDSKLIGIGKLWLYRGEVDDQWVLNFPTKYHWKYPSKIEYLEKGLEKFVATYEDQKITSIAFPLLGSHNGGLNKEVVLELMYSYLGQCNIDIEIYQYQPDGRDDLYDTFASNWSLLSLEEIKARTGIRKDKIEKIDDIISSGVVKSMIGLINEKGIGMKTLEKCFRFVTEKNENQQTLF